MASARGTVSSGARGERGVTGGGSGRLRLLPEGTGVFLRKRLIESLGFTLFLSGLLLVAACLFFDPSDPSLNNAVSGEVSNPLGWPGAYAADLLLQSLGLGAFLLAMVPVSWGWRLMRSHGVPAFTWRLLAALTALLAATLALSMLPQLGGWPLRSGLGGWLGLLLPKACSCSPWRRSFRAGAASPWRSGATHWPSVSEWKAIGGAPGTARWGFRARAALATPERLEAARSEKRRGSAAQQVRRPRRRPRERQTTPLGRSGRRESIVAEPAPREAPCQGREKAQTSLVFNEAV